MWFTWHNKLQQSLTQFEQPPHLFIYSFFHLFIYLLTHSLTHLFTYLLTHLLSYSQTGKKFLSLVFPSFHFRYCSMKILKGIMLITTFLHPVFVQKDPFWLLTIVLIMVPPLSWSKFEWENPCFLCCFSPQNPKQ